LRIKCFTGMISRGFRLNFNRAPGLVLLRELSECSQCRVDAWAGLLVSKSRVSVRPGPRYHRRCFELCNVAVFAGQPVLLLRIRTETTRLPADAAPCLLNERRLQLGRGCHRIPTRTPAIPPQSSQLPPVGGPSRLTFRAAYFRLKHSAQRSF
jgi:hypothetical protein